MSSLFRRRGVLGGGRALWLVVLIGMLWLAPVAHADTRLFPILSVSEQYDSNVFYAPKSVLAPGTKADDFVTFLNPQLMVAHTSALLSGSFSVGGVIGKYLNNSELDFAGVNATTSLNVTQLARRVLTRLTALTITGAYQFTPAASAFGGGGAGFSGVGFSSGGGQGGGVVGPFDSGLVANRVRISSYTMGLSGGYTLSQSTSANFSYMYNQISFGGQFGLANSALQNRLFDTTGHTLSVGLLNQATRNDSLGVNYSYSRFDQGIGAFVTHTGTGTWSRRWSREITSALAGGASMIEPFTDFTAGTPRRVPLLVQPTASAILTWASTSSLLRSAGEGGGALGGRMQASPTLMSVMGASAGTLGGLSAQSGSMMPGAILMRGRYSLSLSYNFGIFPSYVAEAGPIVTHVFGANGNFGVTDRVTAQVGINFARSIGSMQSTTFAFDTYGTRLGLNYLATSNMQVSLTHSWLNFADQSPAPSQVNQGNQLYEFSKHMVMVTVAYVFTPTQSFFRSGGIGSSDGSTGAGAAGSGGSNVGSGTSEKGIQ